MLRFFFYDFLIPLRSCGNTPLLLSLLLYPYFLQESVIFPLIFGSSPLRFVACSDEQFLYYDAGDSDHLSSVSLIRICEGDSNGFAGPPKENDTAILYRIDDRSGG